MKKEIHPEYNVATVKCVCGNEFQTRSTLKEINVEICAACHPFFTGQQKLVDSAGRVERFMRKYGREYAGGGATEGKAGSKPGASGAGASEKTAEKVEDEQKPAPEVRAEEKPVKEVEAQEKPVEEVRSEGKPKGEADSGEKAAE